ncbi:P-loop containing nucleoside triphosphate hydrolase protein [Lipomyces oligophaga]|uniref:P-loop containing nucleoside triphosphate hydrolase protein n=1 Tax=Lipomyces oligophaga TaxID=45792 RepID=UPI0034CE0E82
MSATPSRDAAANSIKVVARFRPQNSIEQRLGGSDIVQFPSENSCFIEAKDFSGSFTFDRVFPAGSKQSDVFDYSIRSTVDDILHGYNGTVFAYGQTGSGKSYSMMGPDIESSERGIIPRIVQQIFACILNSPSEIEYTVRVSYMEIYMERIKDLLHPVNDNLPIHEDKSKSVYVKGLTEIYVSSVEEVYQVMRQGADTRSVASTNMNEESSRSHSIFALVVSQKNIETGSTKSGQLFLVDLAGSEKVGKTGASGQVLEEAKKINKSLSALGMVINALTDGKSSHVPYRDSKLTRILQESLGGNSRTTLIVNCSPSSYNEQETLSTLRFGMRAKNIRNKPKINAEMSSAELKIQVRKLKNQGASQSAYITALESELGQWRNGVVVPSDEWAGEISIDANTTSDSLLNSPSKKQHYGDDTIELQTKLADRETTVSGLEQIINELKRENLDLRQREAQLAERAERGYEQITSLETRIEKLDFEAREREITMDGLKESNAETASELDSVRKQLYEATSRAQDTAIKLEERSLRKREKLREMAAGFKYFTPETSSVIESGIPRENISDAVDNEHQDWISLAISKLDSDDQATELKTYLLEAREFINQTRQMQEAQIDEVESRIREREQVETLCKELEVLVTNAGGRDMTSTELAEYIDTKQSIFESLLAESKRDLNTALDINRQIQLQQVRSPSVMSSIISSSSVSSVSSIADASSTDPSTPSTRSPVSPAASTPTATMVSVGNGNSGDLPSPTKERYKTMKQQLIDFETIKRSLMRDLQNRCERVVELEISLEEVREQYKAVLKTANATKGQQKRMALLERNLDQLTQVQRALVDQNAQLKRECAVLDRKVRLRNERITGLESLLQDSQERLVVETENFEARIIEMKDRLDQVLAGTIPESQSSPESQTARRIVKPMRGGGGTALLTTNSSPLNLQGSPMIRELDSSPLGKGRRLSWFTRT